MKFYCFICTSFFFLLPAFVLLIDESGFLTWTTCSLYLFMHIFYKKYVYVFHQFDHINHKINFTIKNEWNYNNENKKINRTRGKKFKWWEDLIKKKIKWWKDLIRKKNQMVGGHHKKKNHNGGRKKKMVGEPLKKKLKDERMF